MSQAPQPTSHPHVLKAIFDTPWAITPEMLGIIAEVARFRAEGGRFSEDEIQQRIEAVARGPRQGGQRAGLVSVIPMYGVLSQRMNLMSAMSGGTSVEQLATEFRGAMGDPDVSAVVFDIDSPGGAVDGIDELATEIRESRGSKPIVVVANTMAGSAAYYLAAQADEVVVTPSGQVGSIGILAIHRDFSEANEKAGIRTTFITAGKYKGEGHEDLPLTDDAIAYVQAQADEYFGMFVDAVAAGRGVTAERVAGPDFGEGRMLLAKAAVKAGMADRVDTLDATVRRLSIQAQRQPAVAAAATPLAFSERLALATDEAAELVAHARERGRLRAKQGRPGVSEPHREQLSALATSLGSIRSEIDDFLATDDPEPEESTPPPAPRGRPALELFEALGRYGLPSSEVPPS